MVNTYYQKYKKDCEKKQVKDIKIFLQKKKTRREKKPEKGIKILMMKKKKKSISIIRNVSKIYLSIEEIII